MRSPKGHCVAANRENPASLPRSSVIPYGWHSDRGSRDRSALAGRQPFATRDSVRRSRRLRVTVRYSAFKRKRGHSYWNSSSIDWYRVRTWKTFGRDAEGFLPAAITSTTRSEAVATVKRGGGAYARKRGTTADEPAEEKPRRSTRQGLRTHRFGGRSEIPKAVLRAGARRSENGSRRYPRDVAATRYDDEGVQRLVGW